MKKLQMGKKNFETKLIRLTSLLIVILFLSILVLYYSSVKSMYSEQLEKSNENMVEQVAISFETIMDQITDGIYKIPLYDDELLRLINNPNKDMLYQMELQKKLNNVSLGNSYIFSSYLYIKGQNYVYSTEKNNSYPLNDFPDIKAIVTKSNGTISILDPRLVDSLEGRKLLLSVVCPIPLYQGDYNALLVVNIDANKLYYSVLKNIKTDSNTNIYVYNRENTMVIDKYALLVNTKYTPEDIQKLNNSLIYKLKNLFSQRKVILSSYNSQKLNWNFVLETSIDTTYSSLAKFYSIGLSIIFLLIIGLLVMFWIVKTSTKPMKKALSDYNDKLWVDFLTDNNVNMEVLNQQLDLERQPLTETAYSAIVLNLPGSEIDQNLFNTTIDKIKSLGDSLLGKLEINLIVIHKSQLAIIISSQKNQADEEIYSQFTSFAGLVYENLSNSLKASAFISISALKDSIKSLPAAYKECTEALNYKIIYGGSHILQYADIKGAKQGISYEYPNELERQLNNNLMVGNTEACGIFLDKFFENIIDPKYQLSDSEIKNYIYHLQTSVLKTVGSLPIPLKIDSSINILDQFDINAIKSNVSLFISKLCEELNKKDEDEQIHLINCIFEFIDKKATHIDFNLNIAADSLNLNRNYLAKIIKENTGFSFNEYVNKKRITIAKTLLQDKNTPVETIAHEVGFNYSHYFIKVFKSIEGVTPGQYREKLQ